MCTTNGNYFKWYLSDGHTSTYIPKKDRKEAEKLATKKYLQLLLEALYKEKRAIEAYMRKCGDNEIQAANELLSKPGYRELLACNFKLNSKELSEWMNEKYTKNPKYPEQLIYKTVSGGYVRSKSEELIDMALFVNKIPFRYECELKLGENVIYPDFTIRHPQNNKIYYWEHFGMMDEPSYYKSAYSKMQLYTSCGIIPSVQLITTYETKDYPLSSEAVNDIVKYYFH